MKYVGDGRRINVHETVSTTERYCYEEPRSQFLQLSPEYQTGCPRDASRSDSTKALETSDSPLTELDVNPERGVIARDEKPCGKQGNFAENF